MLVLFSRQKRKPAVIEKHHITADMQGMCRFSFTSRAVSMVPVNTTGKKNSKLMEMMPNTGKISNEIY